MPPLRTFSYSDGSEYSGEWSGDGLKHGKGRMKFSDRSLYVGYFQGGLFSGHGVLTLADGSRYEGEFSCGKFAGCGVFSRHDGMKYEGQFKDGAANGHGMMTFPAGIGGWQKSEGYFEDFKLKHKEKSTLYIQKAKQEAEKARQISFLLGA